MIRFYAPDAADTGRLPESDSGHAVRVLRLRAGDELQAVDGRGHVLTCRLADENPRGAAVDIVGIADEPPVWAGSLTVMVAPTKQMERMEWMLEKLVEIGIDRFVPVRCARSERKEIKTERLTRIAVSAMKQSRKPFLPKVKALCKFDDFVQNATEGHRYIAHCYVEVERKDLFEELTNIDDDAPVTVMIGPEGDFSIEEVRRAVSAGFVSVSLGSSRLRTETAGLYAVMMSQLVKRK